MQRAKRTDLEVEERRETGRVGGGDDKGVSTAELGTIRSKSVTAQGVRNEQKKTNLVGEEEVQRIERTGRGVGWGEAMTDSTEGSVIVPPGYEKGKEEPNSLEKDAREGYEFESR